MGFGMRKEGIKPIVQIQSYEDTPFLGQKWLICLENIFSENPLVQLIFIHIYLLSKNQNKMSLH